MPRRLPTTLAAIAAALLILGAGCAIPWSRRAVPPSEPLPAPSPTPSPSAGTEAKGFGEDVAYEEPDIAIAPTVGKDFAFSEIKNAAAMEKAWGFTFSAAERRALADRKFVVKNLLDTGIRPSSTGDNVREFAQLYQEVRGSKDYKDRGQQNAVFWSSDVFLHAYNDLFTELLKEMENETFAPSMRSLSKEFYETARARAEAAAGGERAKWTKVRDYFAVPYAIFSTVGKPLGPDDYYAAGEMRDPAEVQAAHDAADKAVDSFENAATFVRGLDLGDSQAYVIDDLRQIYAAEGKDIPKVFQDEYVAYAQQENVTFKVDFTQFTPRGSYTSSSLRRQYFRGMKWFINVPFFIKSPSLTSYAFAIAQLMAEKPDALRDYDRLESAIGFMVGTSDDLMPVDYLRALESAKGSDDAAGAALSYLAKARDPKIKDLAAEYASVGTEDSDEVRLKTKGLRFFSGKFIIDSYWTGFLTQGDEAPRPGYPEKLPPMASSLEVMALLGSTYAAEKIPTLDFYKDGGKAIDKAMGELRAQNEALTEADWRANLYTSWMWTIKSLFTWLEEHRKELPMFMRTAAWEAKTLMTASASWAELRHATILYAKQSFAEMGAGFNDACDDREVPPPPKAYIEPQPVTYARLRYLAARTQKGLQEQGYELRNMGPLDAFVRLMDRVQAYVAKQLADETLRESVANEKRPDPNDEGKECDEQVIAGESDWEWLRLGLSRELEASVPVPVEGPILPAKDRRNALIADVHTGGDSNYPTSILYQATGVPYVIFTAVSDANGPRLTVGFVSSHHELVKPYGGKRMTDEDWQKGFYQGEDPYDAFRYAPKASWPKPNPWYAPLFDLR